MIEQPPALHIDFHLLDRQIVDRDGLLVGKVDDVELEVGPDGAPAISALLVGQRVLGERLGGTLGGWMVAVADRLSPAASAPPLRVPFDLVDTVGSEVNLSVPRDRLGEPPLETWLREHLMDRIPGADRAGQ